jgi:hypothetical protein
MTTPEDKLAALLREQAETVVPSGGGLSTIQARVARKRRTRWAVLPGAALVTAAAVTAFFVFADADGRSALKQVPGPGTTPSVSETAHPAPSPTVAGGGLDHAFENAALWPFTSAQQIAGWQTSYPYADDKLALVAHYLHDVLHLTGLTTSTTCESCDVVVISMGTRKVGEASLERFWVDGHEVFTISVIGETDLKILTPTNGDAISSPTAVTGLITGVDENVNLSLVTQTGQQIAAAGAPAGSAVPWNGSLTWADATWTHGGIVARTFSPKDGSLNRLTAIPVMRDSQPASTSPTFAGARGGRIDLFDATTGVFQRHLTFPPAGKTDTDAAWSSGTLLWLRAQPTGCNDALYRIDGTTVSTVVGPGGPDHLGSPQLSPDGQTMAWLSSPCGGRAPSIVVRSPAGTRLLHVTPGGSVAVQDVADDGRLLVWVRVNGSAPLMRLLSATDAAVDHGRAIGFSNCTVEAASFDGADPVMWVSCHTGAARLARFQSSGALTTTGPDLPLDRVDTTSVRQGSVLVVGSAPQSGLVRVWRYDSGRLTAVTAGDVVRVADW